MVWVKSRFKKWLEASTIKPEYWNWSWLNFIVWPFKTRKEIFYNADMAPTSAYIQHRLIFTSVNICDWKKMSVCSKLYQNSHELKSKLIGKVTSMWPWRQAMYRGLSPNEFSQLIMWWGFDISYICFFGSFSRRCLMRSRLTVPPL